VCYSATHVWLAHAGNDGAIILSKGLKQAENTRLQELDLG
jgi:hypothetical protein